MFEDFDKWNNLKKSIHARPIGPRCKTREVWWCSIGRNIGSEQSCLDNNFARPVLVIKTFGNTFWGLPITSSSSDQRASSPFYYDISNIPKLKGLVILSQLRSFDNRRLIRKITRLEKNMIREINSRLKFFL